MSIPGLTDRSKSFKEVGRLRKGASKQEGLKDLPYFRPDFRPDEREASERFRDAYGDQPTRINVRLAFQEVERCWDAFYAVYTTAGLLGKAGGVDGREGAWWIYLRDNKTGQVVVKDGEPAMKFDPSVPVYSYKGKKGDDVAVFAKPEGRLSVLIPELMMVNYVTVVTHSWYDIGRISEQLAAIKELAARTGTTLPMVPLVLTRRPEMISIAYDGRKRMAEKWLINIDVRSDWAEAQFRLLDSIKPGIALPASVEIEMPKLPASIQEDEWNAEDYEEPEPAQPEPQPEPEPARPEPQKQPASGRPYQREKLIETLKFAQGVFMARGYTIAPTDRNMVAVNVEACFAGDAGSEEMRRTVVAALTGKTSVKDLTDAEVYSLKRWLNVKPDETTGEWLPDPLAVIEAWDVYHRAVEEAGQMAMFEEKL